MARTVRASFFPNVAGSIAPPFTAFDTVNNETWYNSGREVWLLWNKDATTAAVWIFRSVADPYGRTSDLTVSVPAGAGGGTMKIAGPFPPEAWNQAGTGQANVDYSSGTIASMFAAIYLR